jgi:hypothetical protein
MAPEQEQRTVTSDHAGVVEVYACHIFVGLLFFCNNTRNDWISQVICVILPNKILNYKNYNHETIARNVEWDRHLCRYPCS